MKYNIVVGFISCILIVFSAHIVNADMACALRNEKQALDIRAMQSHLMVAALSCGERNNYNKFIKEHSGELIQNGGYLKKYFKRNYKDNAEGQMNKFITALANESSKKSLDTNSDKFCAEANQMFSRVRTAKVSRVSDFAADKKFTSLHKVIQCN